MFRVDIDQNPTLSEPPPAPLRRRWLAPALWAGLILFATSIPGSALPRVSIKGFDLVVHLALYFVLGVLTMNATATPTWRRVRPVIIGLLAFAALDEAHQRFVPGRTASVSDWAADAVGAVVGVALSFKARGRREQLT